MSKQETWKLYCFGASKKNLLCKEVRQNQWGDDYKHSFSLLNEIYETNLSLGTHCVFCLAVTSTAFNKKNKISSTDENPRFIFPTSLYVKKKIQVVKKYGRQSGKANLYRTLFHLLQLGGCCIQDTNIIFAFSSACCFFPSLISTGAFHVHESF